MKNKNKLIKILIFALICFAIIFTIYKIDSLNREEQKMLDTAKYLVNAIQAEDYDKIRICLKKSDGTDLSDQEITNFLFNTELYRATYLKNDETEFTYITDFSFFNTSEGTLSFSYTALDGDKITNQLDYIHSKGNHYFFTDKLQDPEINWISYPIAIDLANGNTIDIEKSNDTASKNTNLLYYVQDENENTFLKIIENAEEDLKIRLLDTINDENAYIESHYENCYIEWNEDRSVISIYYDKSMENKTFYNLMKAEIFTFSYLHQVLNGNKDWHLTVNYYDCNTKELTLSDVIR